MQAILDNLASVRDRIAEAAQRAGHDPTEIQLVGVSKYVPAELSATLVRAGCKDLGESRPQQLWDKASSEAFAVLDVRWHMIGHLQRNKVARTVATVELIHSVDSPRLLQAVNVAALEAGKCQQVLLEVNCSGESEKHGLTADALLELAPTLGEFPAVDVCGLMTMAAGDGNLATAAENFRTLRRLRDEVVAGGISLPHLSMGMSGDFEVAIAEGATIVRVGSALWEGVV